MLTGTSHKLLGKKCRRISLKKNISLKVYIGLFFILVPVCTLNFIITINSKPYCKFVLLHFLTADQLFSVKTGLTSQICCCPFDQSGFLVETHLHENLDLGRVTFQGA